SSAWPSSQRLGRERDDLHKAACSEFAGHRPKDAGAERLALAAYQDGRVAVEADRAAVVAADLLGGAHDHSAVHVALLDAAARDRLFDRDNDDIADRGGLALRPAEHLDALNPPRAGIVGNVEIGLHLDHAAPPASSPAALRDARRRRGGASGAVSAATRRLPRPGAASAGPSMTIQDLRFEIGRVSSILTASPAR